MAEGTFNLVFESFIKTFSGIPIVVFLLSNWPIVLGVLGVILLLLIGVTIKKFLF